MTATTYPLPALRAGDRVSYEGKPCLVLRVTECSAVLALPGELRTIRPRFAPPVQFMSAPRIVRISAQSDLPLINRPNL
jgi:hypothetical protein